MKVMQINCTWNEGSTGKIAYQIHQALLEQGQESLACYGRGTSAPEPGVLRLCSNAYGKLNNLRSRITGLMYGGCRLSTRRLLRHLAKTRPDVVHLHCINGYFVNIYQLVAFLKEQQIPTVLTLHAEFMYTANCGHALDCQRWRHGCGHCPRLRQETRSLFFDRTACSFQKMTNAFAGFEDRLTVVSVSDWLMERAKASPILAGVRHRVIHNGLDTGVFHPVADARQALGLGPGPLIFHATAMFSDEKDHLKGGHYILELARRLPEASVVVAGPGGASQPLPANVRLLGRIQDQHTLAAWYSAADVTVIASKRETFSMICAESLCCGTPVAGFQAGAPEQISLPQYSSFVPQGDVDALEQAVRRWLTARVDRQTLARQAGEAYSSGKMAQHYINLYREYRT